MSQAAQTTIFVSGISSESCEASLHSAFQPFGEIIEIHMPKQRNNLADNAEVPSSSSGREPHRGFAFVVFSAPEEAEGALDNMHLNEVDGRIISVTPGKQSKTGGAQGGSGGREGWKPVWDDEEWIKQYGAGQDSSEGPSKDGSNEAALIASDQ